MIEFSIPQKGEETRNLKDLVFTLLTEEHSLTIMQIYNKIRKNYNISITYQGVRKAVEYLQEKTILEKTNKKYSLNQKWIIKYKSFFDKLATKEGKNIHEFSRDIVKENYSIYTLNNLLELDMFWGDILTYLPKHLEKDEPKVAIMKPNYCWWMLINLGRETKIYENYKKLKTKWILTKNNPLNKWAAKIYEDTGAKIKFIKDDKSNSDINIVGDTIIKVDYTKQIIKKIEEFFKKYKTVQEMSMKEITEIAHKKCEIKLTIYKDKVFAENFRKLYY
ncbi:hypothetical protein K9L97_02610 [Candidatus Woesearchaeota archaeon]|nr:hypothetical protein [Candidatus Woesearchaeota archaeon]